MQSKFIVVSNRLPVSISKQDGKITVTPSSGGLATAMSSLEVDNRLWVGWPGLPSDDLTPADRRTIARELKKYGCYPVHLTKKQIELFYEGYSNDTLWPLFHYFQSYAQYKQEYWRAYEQVNRQFMRATKRCAADDALVWVQDYQLMLLPRLLREQMPGLSIGYFHHIPFPSYEIFRLLPERKEILQGLLGCDLIGFHIYDYARHFMSSALRVLGASTSQGMINCDGRLIKVDAFPIGIDYAKFRETLTTPEIKTNMLTLGDSYPNQKLVLSVDRLDYSKGIPHRLAAFEQYLKTHPNMHRKVKLVMIAVPSRTEVETYKRLRDQIEQTVSRINGEYGTVDWAPISYQFQHLEFDKLVSLYAMSDVALVTPIRDGMNLVAKEYVASKTVRRPGVLILSEMTGAADELHRAVMVNPNDTLGLAAAIHQALTMSRPEMLARQKGMQERIGTYTVQKWGADFVHDLTRMTQHREEINRKQLRRSDVEKLTNRFQKAKHRLLLLDYDGTLRKFVNSPRPSAAKPSRSLGKLLHTIAHLPDTTLIIVSGRPRNALDKWFPDTSIDLVAEHGAWQRENGIWTRADVSFDGVKKRALPLLESFTVRTAGSVVEEKDSALVWHFRNTPPELAYVRKNDLKRQLKDLLADTDADVYTGNRILEVKPKSVNKGAVARDLLLTNPSDFVLVAGDDYTDEHMFAALSDNKRAYTIKVGPGDTRARYRTPTSESFITLLTEIAKNV